MTTSHRVEFPLSNPPAIHVRFDIRLGTPCPDDVSYIR